MRRYAFVLCVLVAAFAGSYVFVYLYRWEWNRALMSAALFLVAEVALVASLILDRMRRIDAKLDAKLDADGSHERGYVFPSPRAPQPSRTRLEFPWLRSTDEPADRFGVFVPVLMGAGVVLSGIAWLVERLARVAGRRAAAAPSRPSVLALPPGGPFAGDAAGVPSALGPTGPRPRRGVAVTAGMLALAAPAYFLLADLTQTRPDPPPTAMASAVTIEAISNQPWSDQLSRKVEARWQFCADEHSAPLQASALHYAAQHRFVGLVSPALGDQAKRRFAGCLEDAAIDFVLLKVASIDEVG